MERKCIKCGDCCECLAAGFTLDEVRNNPGFPERDFILKHLTPAEKPKQKKNPLMSDRAFDGFFWWHCDLFDAETRLCKDHKNRPDMCRAYPSIHKNEDLISERCGYVFK